MWFSAATEEAEEQGRRGGGLEGRLAVHLTRRTKVHLHRKTNAMVVRNTIRPRRTRMGNGGGIVVGRLAGERN